MNREDDMSENKEEISDHHGTDSSKEVESDPHWNLNRDHYHKRNPFYSAREGLQLLMTGPVQHERFEMHAAADDSMKAENEMKRHRLLAGHESEKDAAHKDDEHNYHASRWFGSSSPASAIAYNPFDATFLYPPWCGRHNNFCYWDFQHLFDYEHTPRCVSFLHNKGGPCLKISERFASMARSGQSDTAGSGSYSGYSGAGAGAEGGAASGGDVGEGRQDFCGFQADTGKPGEYFVFGRDDTVDCGGCGERVPNAERCRVSENLDLD
jgi:hypothetical protein